MILIALLWLQINYFMLWAYRAIAKMVYAAPEKRRLSLRHRDVLRQPEVKPRRLLPLGDAVVYTAAPAAVCPQVAGPAQLWK